MGRQDSTNLQPGDIHKYTVFPQLDREGSQEEALPACVSPVVRIEAITVERTNDIPKRINMAIGELSTGMRTFMCTGKESFLVQTYGDRFP